MANITINGAKYNDVPRVDVPSQSGGVSSFYETNGTLSITENGTYDVKSKENVAVNVSSSGGGPTLDDYLNYPGAFSNEDYFAKNPDVVTNCKHLRNSQFEHVKLTSLTAPELLDIPSRLCANSKIQRVSTPKATVINSYAFTGCSPSSLDLPKVESIEQGAFSNGSLPVDLLELPSLVTLGYSAFMGCSKLKSVSVPKLQTISSYGFNNCRSLIRINLPSIIELGSSAFDGCNSLELADLSNEQANNVLEINSAFKQCSGLKAFIVRSSVVARLSYTDYVPPKVKDGTGFIYVPRALLETYKTATNWSVYAEQFRALEDYTVDGTLSGDIDETKI